MPDTILAKDAGFADTRCVEMFGQDAAFITSREVRSRREAPATRVAAPMNPVADTGRIVAGRRASAYHRVMTQAARCSFR